MPAPAELLERLVGQKEGTDAPDTPDLGLKVWRAQVEVKAVLISLLIRHPLQQDLHTLTVCWKQALIGTHTGAVRDITEHLGPEVRGAAQIGAVDYDDQLASPIMLRLAVHSPMLPARIARRGGAGVCHGVCVGEDLWDAYDRMGLSFAQHAADSPFNAHYDRPAVLAALEPVAGRRVLDAACGPGLYLGELLERGAEVTGFDASPVMVALARQRTAGRVRIDQAVLGEPLPYPDGAFDLVVCALAIHYARDRAAAFAEFCRVLRPGGAAVVSTQHPVVDWLRKGGSYFHTTLETDIWHTPSGDQPVAFWREPLAALCAAATDAGFLIGKLIEPVPAETMRERYPAEYEQLSREPGFLILRLLKPATAS
jgi:SAM-dependent methyltransferase